MLIDDQKVQSDDVDMSSEDKSNNKNEVENQDVGKSKEDLTIVEVFKNDHLLFTDSAPASTPVSSYRSNKYHQSRNVMQASPAHSGEITEI